MKKVFKVLASMLAIAAFATVFVACGDDDPSPAVVEVTSVKVTPTTLPLEVGEKETLTATVEPSNATDKTITWSSDKPTIAEVNASTGEVTAKAIGTATITATASNGKSATCAVTVAEEVIAVTGITLVPTELELKVGDDTIIVATVEPSNATVKTVTWSSSAPDTVEVKASGEVTAKAAGTATITATAGSVSKTVTVTVTENAIEVTDITFVPDKLELEVDEKGAVVATVLPENATDKTVTWSSSAPDTVAVNASTGEVTAKAVGTATITATAGTISKSVTVTVTEKVDITFTPDKLALEVDGKQTIVATVEPEDATITWSSNNTAIAEVNASGEVTAKAIGTAAITATVTTATGKTASKTVSVTVWPIVPFAAWLFDDPSDFTKATIGQDLEAVGGGFTAVDGGVRVALGSYYKATHGMEATRDGRVKEFTLMFDYRLTTLGGAWYGMYQSDLGNGGDSDLWIDSGDGSIGVEDYGSGNNPYPIPLETTNYHRLVVSFNLPEMKIYVDGVLAITRPDQGREDRHSLDPAGVLFFADASQWDTDIDISAIAIWNKQLTDAEVAALGAIGE